MSEKTVLSLTQAVAHEMEMNQLFFLDVWNAYGKYKNDDFGLWKSDEDLALNQEAKECGGMVVAKYNTCEGDIFIVGDYAKNRRGKVECICETIMFSPEY